MDFFGRKQPLKRPSRYFGMGRGCGLVSLHPVCIPGGCNLAEEIVKKLIGLLETKAFYTLVMDPYKIFFGGPA